MAIFAQARSETLPTTARDKLLVIIAAATFTVLAVAQLFGFEKLPDILRGLALPGGAKYSLLYAALIVFVEIFAIPSLLAMRLSPAMRMLSITFGWLTWIAWLIVTTVALSFAPSADNVGLLGTAVKLPVSLTTLMLEIFLAVIFILAQAGRRRDAK